MAEDSVLNLIASEFKLWGVKLHHRITGGGHIELAWQVSPDKEVRKTYIPHTGSEYRGWLNKRSEVRRLFKQDGLSLKEPPKPVPLLQKALSMPAPVETDKDQIRAVRAELVELTEVVIEMGAMISNLLQQVSELRVVAPPIEVPVFIEAAAAPERKKPSVRSVKTIDYLSESWSSTAALARDMGLDVTVAYRKLYYLMRQNKIEVSDGQWRKKPARIIPMNGSKHKRMHA